MTLYEEEREKRERNQKSFEKAFFVILLLIIFGYMAIKAQSPPPAPVYPERDWQYERSAP